MKIRIKPGRALILGVVLLAVTVLTGCASFRGEAPRLNIVNLKVVEATPLEQRYQVRLRIQNPNNKGLTMDGLNFDLYLNDKHFVSGMTGQKVKVSRYGDAVVDVMATSTVFGFYRQLMALAQGQGKELNYKIKGKLSLQGYQPLPFERKGDLSPQALSGKTQ